MSKEKLKKLFWEIFRFGIVGGIAFLVDTGVFLFMNRVGFGQPALEPLILPTAISTAAGFVVGLLTNYLLSRVFVFTSPEQKENGKGKRAFFLFTVVSVIGFIMTEVLLLLFSRVIDDIWAKIFSTCIVMIWNYLSRKILIFK